jgi:hypothetical protein
MKLMLAAFALLLATTPTFAQSRPSCVLRVDAAGQAAEAPVDLSTTYAMSDSDLGLSREFDLNLVVLKNGGNFFTLLSQDELPPEVGAQLATFALVRKSAVAVALIVGDDETEAEIYMDPDKRGNDLIYDQPAIVMRDKGPRSGRASVKIDLPGDDATVVAACTFG